MAKSYTQLSAGDLIGKCEIVRLLGKGGMGAVYLAKHTTLDILVAVKTLAPDAIGEDRRESNRFLREARLAAQIRHPNVVAIMDADMDEENGLYYIVMEYVDGGNLAEYLQSGPLDTEWVYSVIYQTTQALQEASRFGIIHRDIKPHNIIVNEQGVAKLADLGLAKSMGHDSVSLTVMGSALGTPAYMSPQQAADAKTADARDDIYSLGATLYQCLTGNPPFDGDSVYSIITKVVTKSPADPRLTVADAPSALVAVCAKMMAREREQRYANADALMADLEVIRNEGLHAVANLAAADFLHWPGSPRPVDPDAPTELMSPTELREVAAKNTGSPSPPLTQQAVLPAARQDPGQVPGAHLGRVETEELSARTLPPGEPKKTSRVLMAGGLAVAILLLGGVFFWRFSGDEKPPPLAAAPAESKPAAPTPAPAPVAPTGRVYVETQPAGAKVVLDDAEPRPSPATFARVPVGSHTVQVEMEGYETQFLKVSVEEGEIARPELVALQPIVGSLVITTQPSDARVTMPSGEVKQSPVTFKDLPVGSYKIIVEKDGYTSQTVTVNVHRREVATPPRIKLVARTGSLFVATQPPGAKIIVAGQAAASAPVSPATIPHLPAGKQTVELELTGYAKESLEVAIQPGQVTTAPVVTLQALTSTVEIAPNMAGCHFDLYQAGESIPLQSGRTPTKISQLTAGRYRLVVTHPSDLPDLPLRAELDVALKAGERKKLQPKLAFGSLSIQASPSKTMVFISGKEMGFAPRSYAKVPIGKIETTLRQPGYEALTLDGMVQAGSTLRLEGQLKRSSNSRERRPGNFPRPPHLPFGPPGG